MWYKNVRAQNLLIFLLAFGGLAGSFYFVNLAPQLTPEEKHQIAETVFSDLFDYIKSHPDEDPDYFFIGVSGSDPSPRLLNSFRNDRPLVEPMSSSEMTFGLTSHVAHRSDPAKRGFIVNLEILDKEPNGNVKALTYMYLARGSSATYEYTLNENKGVYKVISITYPERL